MLLSIGMMVKNESKYLRQCLESLQPIRDSIDSELIIVDTGSTDNTVEIAKEFTEKVYYHEWKNNFSEMRNITIGYCIGKWFMCIDGDEIIEDSSDIIEFFKSNIYKKYNTACISLKNITSINNENNYSIALSPRFFKKDRDFRFEGVVHNQPKFKKPICALTSKWTHYGYINNDKDLMERKFQRTATILKNELKKNPDDIYYLFQLSGSYAMHEEFAKALEPIHKAYKLIKTKKMNVDEYLYVYAQLAKIYMVNGKFEELEQICIEGIEKNSSYLDLYFYLAKAQINMNKNNSAIKSYNEYLVQLKEYKTSKIYLNTSITSDTLGRYEEAYLDLSALYDRIGEFESVLQFSRKITSDKILGTALSLIISSNIKLDRFNELRDYYEKEICINHIKLKDRFLNYLEQYLIKADSKTSEKISKAFLNGNSEYSLLNRCRIALECQNEELIEKIKSVDFRKLPNYYGDLLYYLLRRKVSLKDFLNKVNEAKIKSYFDFLFKKYNNFEMKIYEYLVSFENSELKLDIIRINKILATYVFKSNSIRDDQCKRIFDYYLKLGYYYLKQIYNNNIIQNELVYYMKDEEDLFLMYMYLAQKHKSDKSQYLRNLKVAFDSCTYMQKCIGMLGEEVSLDLAENSDEINEYKKKVKEAIIQMVDNNNLIDAKRAISGYEEIIKEDVEICSIKAVIAIMENRFDDAIDVLESGLKIDNNNFDLIYNLAYANEQKGEKNKAVIYYKRARKLKYYEPTIKFEIDKIIENILSEENEESELYRFLNKIQNVLFIDFNLTKEVNNLAKSLDEYGINVDLSYNGINPESKFNNEDLAYRKLLGITNIDHLIEYINNYCYDIVHIFNVPNNIRRYIKERSNSSVIFNNELLSVEINEVIKFYCLNKKVNNKRTDENSSKESLTILIPTYNRTNYLERILTYFNNFEHLKPYIFVLDSSFEDNKVVNEATAKSFNNEKIKYYHFESSVDFFAKLNFGIEKITTDYVALCADDDFLTEEGIMESVRVLEKNQKLYSVKGKNLYFVESMSKLKEYDFFEGLYEDKAIERLKNITKGFVPSLIYQVFRVDKFKSMYLFIENNINDLPKNQTFTEYLFYFMVICTGRLGKINLDLNIRDKSVPREAEFKNFPHAVLDGSFNDDYKRFCSFLSKYIEVIEKSGEEFDKNIHEIFKGFLINFLKVPKENVIINNDEFDIKQLEIGMRKCWVWPSNL